MTKKNTFKCNKSWGDVLDKLPDESRLRVYDAIFLYARTRTSPELDLMGEVAFVPIRAELDEDMETYANVCKRNKDNIGKRWNTLVSENIPDDTTPLKRTEKEEDKETEKEKDTKEKDKEKEEVKEEEKKKLLEESEPQPPIKTFKPPTYNMVKEYFVAKGRPDLDPQDFIDYYDKVGWVVGANKKKMTLWRGAAAGWMSRNKNLFSQRQLSLRQDDTSLGELNKWMIKYTPNIVSYVDKLLSQDELDTLKEVWTSIEIADVLTRLDNRPDLCKKYANLYTTLRCWLEKGQNHGSSQQ